MININIAKPTEGEVLKKAEGEKIKGDFTIDNLEQRKNYTMVITIFDRNNPTDRNQEIVNFSAEP